MSIQNKKEALEVLSKLPEKTLIRIATLSNNKEAQSYFSCPIKFGAIKGMLGV